MNTQLTAARHFQARKPYTPITLSNMRQQKFQARINTGGDDGVSEDISAYIPIVSRTDNMEILIHEVIPALVRLKPGFGWTWPTLYDRLNWCLDEDMSTIYTRIKDGIARANRNEAGFKGTIRNLITDTINRDFPRDDIVEMMQTSLRKPNDVTPTEHYERFVQLKKCADWTNGTCNVPTDQEIKTYWLRSHPVSMRDNIKLRGLNQDSDLADLKEALDEANTQYHRNRSNQDRNRGRNQDRADGDDNNRNRDRSRSRSRNRSKTARYDYSQGPRNVNRGNRNSNSKGSSSFNIRTDANAPCPLHPGMNHNWGQCFENRFGENYRGGRGNGGRGGRGGRGGGQGRGGGSYNSSGSRSGNNQGDSHHVDNSSTSRGQNQGSSIAGTTNQGANQNNMGPPANIYAQDTHAVEPVLVNNWGNADNASVESSLFSRTPRNGSTIIQN